MSMVYLWYHESNIFILSACYICSIMKVTYSLYDHGVSVKYEGSIFILSAWRICSTMKVTCLLYEHGVSVGQEYFLVYC